MKKSELKAIINECMEELVNENIKVKRAQNKWAELEDLFNEFDTLASFQIPQKNKNTYEKLMDKIEKDLSKVYSLIKGEDK